MLNFAKDLAAALDALRRHAILFLLGVTFVALALLGRSWLDAHDASLRLQATLAAQQKTITDADQRQSTRDAQLTQTLAQIAAAKQKVQTPTQAAAALAQSIPQLIAGASGGETLQSPITIELSGAGNADSQNEKIGVAGLSGAAKSPTAGNSTAAAKSTATNPTDLNGSSGAAKKYPWVALKLELAKLGIGHTTKVIANKDIESPDGTAHTEKENMPTGDVQGNSPMQSSAGGSMKTSTQSTLGAQRSSPPIPDAKSESNSSSTRTNTKAAPGPAIIRVPQEDLKSLYDGVEDCQTCQAKLSAAQADLSDEKTKFTAATTERDAAIAATRGTFWKRTRTAAKWIVIGAAAGAVLSRYH